jgi:hypothetical protein
MEPAIRNVTATNYIDFLQEAIEKAHEYFKAHNIDLKGIVCAVPAYIYRNMGMMSTEARPEATINGEKPMGVVTVLGYENRLVFYWPDWHYHKHIIPFNFEIPNHLKL